MIKKIILAAVLMIVLAFNAAAYVDVTRHFNQNRVDYALYTCLDPECAQVSTTPFSDSGSSNAGEITIVYPSTLRNFGYAAYFVSPGYVPMEYIDTWHSYGNNGHFPQNLDIDFYKIAGCHSVIDDFSVTNDAHANEPLVIYVDASLDAETFSAFYETDTGVLYVPPQFKDEYYSAETRVTLEIRDHSGNIVNQQSQDLLIYMSTSQRVEFTWTPTADGEYTARAYTDVTDGQCSSSIRSFSSKLFRAQPERPRNMCYTLLNELTVRDPSSAREDSYIVGDSLVFSYSKIANYADNNGDLTPIGSRATYTIRNAAGNIVYNNTADLAANQDNYNSTLRSFSWTAAASGWYDVYVSGYGNSNSCAGVQNPAEEISEHFFVSQIPTYSLTFQVSDNVNGAHIQDAAVSVDGVNGTTDADGMVTLGGFLPGNYTYTITHPTYFTVRGAVKIVNVDLNIYLTMSRSGNRPPVITGLPDVTIARNSFFTGLDLDNYVEDSDNTDAELVWTYSGNSNINVNIDANHVLTLTPRANWMGQETITFRVRDPSGASASDSILVRVTAANTAPTITGLPDVTINEDQPLLDAFNLNNYASDAETLDSGLLYDIVGVSDANCGVSIDAYDNIDIQPKLNWHGSCIVTVSVSDGSLSNADSFTVTVLSVNDNPVVAGIPDVTFAPGGFDNSIDLDYYVHDVEDSDDLLTWTYSGNTNIIISIGANHIVTFTAVPGFLGSETITFIATDRDGGSGSDVMTAAVSTGDNAAPIVNIISPLPTTYNALAVLLSIATFDDGGVNRVWYTIAGNTYDYNGLVTLALSDKTTYTLAAYASDISGNIGSDSVTFNIDTDFVPPIAPERKKGGVYMARVGFINDGFIGVGEDLTAMLGFENTGNFDLDEVRATVVIPDLGIIKSAGPFDLEQGDEVTRAILLELSREDIAPGEYTARIVVSNDKVRRVRHRPIVIT